MADKEPRRRKKRRDSQKKGILFFDHQEYILICFTLNTKFINCFESKNILLMLLL